MLNQTLSTLAQSLGVTQCKAETAQVADWNTLCKGCSPGGKADSAIIGECRVQYVFGYCGAAGIAVAIAKDRVVAANPDAMSKADADAFDAAKRRARSAFGMGIARAFERLGIEPPAPQNSGGRKKGAAEGAKETAKESLTILPPSFVAKVRELQERVVAFQSTAKLTKVDKESIGKIAECVTAIVAALDAPPTPESKLESK